MAIGRKENEDKVREALVLACFRRGSQKAFALENGISEVVLSDMIRGRRDVSARIAQIVGFERITIYRELTKKSKEKVV
jgi:DNA-binding transcriptional regulator YdaS (Cro superfamily)